ncbi:phosphatase PAP2 family protein (plasmid) [Mesorhizobium sp. AaZ16]|uniref:phosphatase PAP2 family protein n=1 Tax=Mesorhizobium sp. AaZ16 TaxID=3402289 RepID=UPI00374E6EC5
MGGNRLRLIVAIGMVTVIFAVVDGLWLQHSTVSLDSRNFEELAKTALIVSALLMMAKGVTWRLRGDPSPTAKFIRHAAAGLHVLLSTAVLFVPLAVVTTIFMYLASATERPLVDAYLATRDAALGFDWLSFLEAANKSPLLSGAMTFAYHSLGPQVVLLFLLLCFCQREERMLEFVALLAIFSLSAALGMIFYPAVGAYAYFQPPPELYSNFSATPGMWHYAELEYLRSGEPYRLLLTRTHGLVTFPSFHTALGMFVVYACRDFRILAFSVGVLNSVMVVGTIPEGGHHLVDVLVGGALALLVIGVVRYGILNERQLKEAVHVPLLSKGA